MSTSILRSLPFVVAGLTGAALLACGSSSSRSGFENDGGTSSSSSSSSSSGFVPTDGGPTTNTDGCSDEAKLVYVLSLEGDVYSFAPADKKFTKVGPVNCANGRTPISMAVDRNAVAWLNMRDLNSLTGGDDQLYKFDTKTAKCSPSSIKGSMGGMGFSIDQGSTDKETLFIAGMDPNSDPLSNPKVAINKVDFAAQQLVPIGDLKDLVDLELTGTGDGRLYGFIQDTPLAIVQIDKSSLAFSNRADLPQVTKPQPPMYAFSFWGGDFYIYTATSTSASQTTNVTRYRPSDKSVDTSYMTNIGFHIVGAGVSTCAPTVSPN